MTCLVRRGGRRISGVAQAEDNHVQESRVARLIKVPL